MTPHPDPIFHCAGLRPAGTPTLADRPPIVTPKDICNYALPLLEGGWTPRGAHDAEDRSCNALSPRARRFSLDAALRRATYDLRGRQYRNWLDPEDTAGAALIALSGHIHSMLSKALPPDRPLAFDTVCDTQELAAAALIASADSLPEYPGLRPRTETKRRKAGVHAFLVEAEEAATLQRYGRIWRIHGFGNAGHCRATITLAGVKRHCETFAFVEAEKTRRYRIAKRERIARLLTIDRSPGVWRQVRHILENPLDHTAPASTGLRKLKRPANREEPMTKAGKEYLRQCFRKVGLDLGWAPKPHVARILKDGEYQKQFPSWREVEAWLSGYERALKHHAPELYGRSEAARHEAMWAKD